MKSAPVRLSSSQLLTVVALPAAALLLLHCHPGAMGDPPAADLGAPAADAGADAAQPPPPDGAMDGARSDAAGGDAGAGPGVMALAVGVSHSCAIQQAGAVKCWGGNGRGQLGLGVVPVPGVSYNRGDDPGELGPALPVVDLGAGRSARALAAGYRHTCAILDDRTLKCWGSNLDGELGLGDRNDRGDNPGEMGDALAVVKLGTGRTVLAVSAGGSHSCALLDDRSVKCWGVNGQGMLGLGNTEPHGGAAGTMGDALPVVDLGAGRSARAVFAGGFHSCAILDDGKVKCWGFNDSGQLGLGDARNRGPLAGQMGDALPSVDLGTGRRATSLALGYKHTCAVLDDGSVKCWGSGLGGLTTRGDDPGEMGDNLPVVALGAGAPPQLVVSGDRHVCALLVGGAVKCWGDGFDGQLGHGSRTSLYENLPVVSLGAGRTVTALSAASRGRHSCVALDDRSLKCWGSNEVGQLGLGDTRTRGDDPGEMGDALGTVPLW